MSNDETSISKTHMKAVDRMWFSPGERASKVFQTLTESEVELTTWDLICFCVEYLGQQTIALEDDNFTLPVIAASRWVYGMHYSHPAHLLGKPDKKRGLHVAVQEDESQEVRVRNEGRDRERIPPHHEGDPEAQGQGGESRTPHVDGGDSVSTGTPKLTIVRGGQGTSEPGSTPRCPTLPPRAAPAGNPPIPTRAPQPPTPGAFQDDEPVE